jgi:hypothetical protein
MLKYIAYIPNNLTMETQIKLYHILSQKETAMSFKDTINIFPIPPPFSMWGTPTGHLHQYPDLKFTSKLSEYNELIDRRLINQLFFTS